MIRNAVDRFRAFMRSERRINPDAVRGRIYERKSDDTQPDFRTRSKGSATILAKVIRANGQVEDMGVISKAVVKEA